MTQNNSHLIVDLHIHSHYSRATSKAMNIASLYEWGKIKGIDIMGTGDFTHPAWFAELREKLTLAENGLFTLKSEFAKKKDASLPEIIRKRNIRFILTVEVSTIYSKGGKVRKLHNIIVVPSFAAASKINSRLSQIGNIRADGRPILGLDSKELLKIALEADNRSLFIPAHIWTPWFSMFGSKSGFDSIKEAFDEMAPEIKAIETGLSSDPFMNWRLSQLDQVTLLSHSDAHSPQKLGREANVIKCDIDYSEIISAIKTGDDRFIGTIEFYPQEGKYHYDGHRVCGIRFSPPETKKHNGLCPKCGKPLVVGVDYRVDELADRPHDFKPEKHKSVEYIIPLTEIIAESKNIKSTTGKVVMTIYEKLYKSLGDEFTILRSVPIKEISRLGYSKVAEGIARMRSGKLSIQPGFDGVYGTISIFGSKKELDQVGGQMGLGI